VRNLKSAPTKTVKRVSDERRTRGSELQSTDLDCPLAATNLERTLLRCFREIPSEEKRVVLLLATALASFM
jgi:hypothetical protein